MTSNKYNLRKNYRFLFQRVQAQILKCVHATATVAIFIVSNMKLFHPKKFFFSKFENMMSLPRFTFFAISLKENFIIITIQMNDSNQLCDVEVIYLFIKWWIYYAMTCSKCLAYRIYKIRKILSDIHMMLFEILNWNYIWCSERCFSHYVKCRNAS